MHDCDVFCLNALPVLPTIGTINWRALRGQKPLANKEKFLALPHPLLATLVGLIDGDGYIAVNAQNGYVAISLVIGLDVADHAMLLQLQAQLGFGRVTGPVRNKDGTTTVKLIFSKTELQELLLPLMVHHNLFFLTATRRQQFNKLMYAIANGITRYADMPGTYPESALQPALPTTAAGYANLHFFNFWLIGFTVAEGSFLVKANGEACFQLKQRPHPVLFAAFQLVFKTRRKITVEFAANANGASSNNGVRVAEYHQFAISSKNDVQTVVNFFNDPAHNPYLMGAKRKKYYAWLAYLQQSKQYQNVQF